jgi:hypothetical protein
VQVRHATTSPILTYDRELMARLLTAYRAAEEHASRATLPVAEPDMWDIIVGQEMLAFKRAIDCGDLESMFHYLSNIGMDYVWYGGLSLGIDGYTPRDWEPSQAAELYWEKMIALAEACGALCLENPESGAYHSNIRLHPDDVRARIETQLGISLSPPDQVLPTFGFAAGSNVFHYRHINAIYAAQLVAQLAPEGGRVAEIGGGLGLLALFSGRMKTLSYTIYDLPVSCLISGFFLAHAIGHEYVCLFGEEEHNAQAVHLKPYWSLADAPAKSFDVVVNQDGLNEIHPTVVEFLVQNLERTSRSYFLSLNHETFGMQHRVANYMSVFSTMQRLWRSKNWVREGYVDELYGLGN